MKLLDVNVWLAAAWARHVHHATARAWLDAVEHDLAFCRVTQMALLRLITNQAVMGDDARTRREAWDIVDSLMADPRVSLAPEPEGLSPIWVSFSKRDDRSHLLWTDDYLAAFAHAAGAELVTLDDGLRARHPAVRVECLL